MAAILCVAVACPGCFRGGMFPAIVATALITAAVVSSVPPPPPREVYVPVEQPGYTWQSGYWVRHEDDWVWVPGHWVLDQPGQAWVPDHWEQLPDGTWHFIAGRWMPAGPVAPQPRSLPPPPPNPPPPPP